MRSFFDTAGEWEGEPFRTTGLPAVAAADRSSLDRLAAACAVVKAHFLASPGWHFRIHEGSLTFRHGADRHRSVKLFVDKGNVLAQKCGLTITADPVVIGVELSGENPFVRSTVRNFLRSAYGELYLDPREHRPDTLEIIRNCKYWIVPHNDHFYDILFLPRGACAYEVDPQLKQRYEKNITPWAGRQVG